MAPQVPRRFIHLFGGPRESSDLVGIARGAVREGYAVLPIKPGGKTPLCTLTARQAAAADRMASNAAKQAGQRRWEAARHECGLSHAITDEKEAERVFKRLVDTHPDLNLALECSQSRLICVDCDNIDELRSFTEMWALEEGIAELANSAPTVRTPGKIDENGAWVHRDGGHYWFLLPDGTDFTGAGVSTSLPIGIGEAKAQIRYGRSYALVPPSVRDEGPYVMASDIGPCPEWLVDILCQHVEGVATRRVSHTAPRDGTDEIDVWASATTWDELLSGDEWTSRGRPDNCGCPVWTRPGEWTNPKSATAHEPGCMRWDNGGFLHIWTDNPPEHIAAYRAKTGHSSMSKLQYVSWRDHGGNDGDAMRALKITGPSSEDREPTLSTDEIFDAAEAAWAARLKRLEQDGQEFGDAEEAAETTADLGEGDDYTDSGDDGDTETTEETAEDDEELSPFEKLRAEFISAADLDKIPPLAPLVEGILDFHTTTRIIGQSGHGKTFVMLDMAAHIVTGRSWQGRPCAPGRVAYIVAEGIAGFTQRVRAWERHHNVELGDGLMVLPRPVQAANVTEWAVLVEVLRYMKPAMVVIDTQARVTVGMEESSATEMGVFIDRADRIKIATGACVVLVHHQGHSGDHGRGSSAVLGALDAEIAVAREGRGGVALMSSKQKDREDFEPIRLRLLQVEVPGFKEPSAVIVGRLEVVGDAPLLPDTGIGEESPCRDRLAMVMYRSYEGGDGFTQAQWWVHVRERDRGPKGTPMSRGAFYKAWDKLDSDEVLILEETKVGKRFHLAPSEAVRLGLTEAPYGD